MLAMGVNNPSAAINATPENRAAFHAAIEMADINYRDVMTITGRCEGMVMKWITNQTYPDFGSMIMIHSALVNRSLPVAPELSKQIKLIMAPSIAWGKTKKLRDHKCSIYYLYDGVMISNLEVARLTGLNYQQVVYRLRGMAGMDITNKLRGLMWARK